MSWKVEFLLISDSNSTSSNSDLVRAGSFFSTEGNKASFSFNFISWPLSKVQTNSPLTISTHKKLVQTN